MQRRCETLLARNIPTIDDYNRENDVKIKHLLLLVDDLDFIRDKKDALQGFIVPLLQKGRAVGIHLIIGTNRKRESYFYHAISMNCSSKFYFEEDEKESLEYIESKFGVSIDEIIEYVKEHDSISVSYFQRRYCMGYPKAAKLMERLVDAGIISASKKIETRE
jgi:DNA segregation ATPase FtsK/SpoIIIE-like protein